MPVLNTELLIEDRIKGIRRKHKDARAPRAQLDVSGGLDSAVMLGLLARTVGPENITAVYSSINSSGESQERAQECADVFGVKLISIDLSEIYGLLISKMVTSMEQAGTDPKVIQDRYKKDPTVLGSIRSCLRAPVGRGYNRLAGNGIRHGTGNECEDRWLRFYQKGGDGEVDTNPLAMLSKGEVFQLAITLGVPTSIVEALPTPDLQGVGEAHNDEDELKAITGVEFTYSRVDSTTGEYTRVGTIEQISRFADIMKDEFFGKKKLVKAGVERFAKKAQELGFFPGFSEEEIRPFIAAANLVELQTRHKLNPNCPSLGDRASLVKSGILTDDLF